MVGRGGRAPTRDAPTGEGREERMDSGLRRNDEGGDGGMVAGEGDFGQGGVGSGGGRAPTRDAPTWEGEGGGWFETSPYDNGWLGGREGEGMDSGLRRNDEGGDGGMVAGKGDFGQGGVGSRGRGRAVREPPLREREGNGGGKMGSRAWGHGAGGGWIPAFAGMTRGVMGGW